MAAPDRLDRLRGMLWGAALGDALGAQHEFRYQAPLRHYRGRLERPLARQTQWQGRSVGVVGQVTDDTEMLVALAGALVAAGGYDRGRAADAYLAWAASRPPFMGANTRAHFAGVATRAGFERRLAASAALAARRAGCESNGCLMRAAPLAALGPEAWIDAAVEDCRLTNPRQAAVEAVLAHVAAARALLAGEPVHAAYGAARDAAEHPEVVKALEDGWEGRPRDVAGPDKGWAPHAVYCAFRALAAGGGYAAAIDAVVRLGGDTDTNAAIAGALVGARLGCAELEAEPATAENLAVLRAADPGAGGLPRPPRYGVGRLDALAAGLAALPQ